jgi:UrcA family protein
MKTITLRNNMHIAMAAAAVCLATATFGARADEAGTEVQARTVHYADLNLNTEAGVAALYDRIRNAAEHVCPDVGSRELARAVAAQACVDRAIARSVKSVNNPKLTSEFAARMGLAQKQVNVAALR